MKKLELQPTEANFLNTLNEDVLNRNTSLYKDTFVMIVELK